MSDDYEASDYQYGGSLYSPDYSHETLGGMRTNGPRVNYNLCGKTCIKCNQYHRNCDGD